MFRSFKAFAPVGFSKTGGPGIDGPRFAEDQLASFSSTQAVEGRRKWPCTELNSLFCFQRLQRYLSPQNGGFPFRFPVNHKTEGNVCVLRVAVVVFVLGCPLSGSAARESKRKAAMLGGPLKQYCCFVFFCFFFFFALSSTH